MPQPWFRMALVLLLATLLAGMERGSQTLCPAGTYHPPADSGQVGDCQLCPPGAFCPAGTLQPVPCPRGTSRQSPGARLLVACVPCPAGYHCPDLGTTKPIPCSPGSFSGSGYRWCQECPGGKLCNQTALSRPATCPPGHYCPARGLQPIPCPMGTFREAPEAAHEEDCLPCQPGAFCGRVGLVQPQGLCLPGYHCGPGSNTSSPEGLPFGDLCPPGHFCMAGTKYSRQQPCPAGTWNAEKGAPDRSWCLPCPPGLFCASTGQSAPSGLCAPGFYCPEGAQTPRPSGRLISKDYTCLHNSLMAAPGQDQQHSLGTGAESIHLNGTLYSTAGGPCPQGHFCPVGTGLPLPCPVGTFSDRMFLSMASQCLSCTPGHFCGASGLSAPSGPCSSGYFCLSGVSSPTPAGHSEQGDVCPRGHFCPRGTNLPSPCPAGSYSNLTGQASCSLCPAGYYCPENTSTYNGFPCPAGFYCPRGTKFATQYPCPRGYYNPDARTQSLDSCLPCPPGHFCGQENLTQPSGPCDAGWFCVSAAWTARPFDLDNYTSTNCLCPATATGGKCPAGSFCPEGSPEPTPCLSGVFCATSGLSTPSGPCQAGYFCTEGASSATPEDGLTGAPCPPGTFCPAESARPRPCPAGTFSSLSRQTVPDVCQACPSGFYCKEAGLQAPSGQCPAGYYCDSTTGPVQDFSLHPCPQGYFCPLGTAMATQHSCPEGTYGAHKGLKSINECELCPAGKFCALAGLRAPTGDCAAGHWCKGGATSKDPTDGPGGLLCPRGHYCLSGTPTPTRCPPGTWSEEGTRTLQECRDCHGGQLCPEGHMSTISVSCCQSISCKGASVPASTVQGLLGSSCPPGHFCSLEMTDPLSCPPGFFNSDTHKPKCYICPRGHYCVPGMKPQLCPRGFYCPEGTAHNWQPCPPGTYGPVSGLSDLLGCKACDRGHFCPDANATAAGGQCWEGFFCFQGSTQPNPEAGTEDEAGPCPQGHYCPKGSAMPQPCPVGTFSAYIKLGSEAACSSCPPGHFCSSTGLTSPSGTCHSGFFCLGGALDPQGSLREQTGGPCPTGHFCPAGTATPQPCPAGTHNELTAQGHCKPCPQGFFCPENTSSVVGNRCPAGHYCPAATSSASQFPCPRGTYRPQTGGIQSSDCAPCDPGSYCSLPGLATVSGPCSAGFHCTWAASVPSPTDGITGNLCPPGHFCPQSSARPTPCPPGLFLPIPGASSLEDCQPCPAGWFCSRAGLSSPEALCEGGWFCPGASVSGHSPGTLCPLGHSCPPGSLEAQLCPPGQYQDEPGQSHCKTCPAGKFCSSSILSPGASPFWPVDCPAGYYCPPGTQIPTQHPCPGGTVRERPGGRSIQDCRPCPAGYFCLDSGVGKRFPDGPCSAGYYCPPGQTTATPPSFPCPQGFYCPEGSPQPRACENGTFQPHKAKGFCELCPEGFYCETLGSAPGLHLCLRGHFCPPGSHSATAHPCPRGTYGPRQGATEELDCEMCPAGMFCASEGLSQPSGSCHPAYYCSGGAISPTPIQHKVQATGLSGNDICPPGFFCPLGTGSPVPCRPGFYSSVPGLSREDQCQPCPSGHYCSHVGPSHAIEAGLCHAGYICLGGSAVPAPSDGIHGYRCPPGFHCPAGAHVEFPCEPGTFSPFSGANTCLLCPGGTYCPKAATVEPTICPKGPCSAGYYCKGNAASPTPRKSLSSSQWIMPLGHFCSQGTVYPWACPERIMRNIPGFYCPEGSGMPTPCPSGAMSATAGAKQQEDCGHCPPGRWCKAGHLATSPCPAGHYCPGGSETHKGAPQACPVHTYLAAEGSQSQTECLPCPAGYLCPFPGLSSFEGYLCPPGHWCPGAQGAFLCPPGTFRTEPGASSQKECELCPPGHYCPSAELRHHSDVSAIPCRAGTECPAGAVAEVTCRAGSYCGPQTGVPPLCPGGYVCPVGSSTYAGPGQRCVFPYYCPLGSAHPRACSGGSEALRGNVLRVSKETCCRLCEEGHYRSQAFDAQPCQPCPPGYSCRRGTENYEGQLCPVGHYCPAGAQSPRPCPPGTFRNSIGAGAAEDCLPCPASTFNAWPGQTGCLPCGSSAFSPTGASHCTCRGLNRVFQKLDGSCICQAGYEFYEKRDLEHDETSSDEDCQPQMAEQCHSGVIRLAATRKCVSAQHYDCSVFCHPEEGELNAELGICQCQKYISAEKLCDAQCLSRASHLILTRGPSKELIISMKGEAGQSIQREVASSLGPDQFFWGQARVHLVQCSPHGIFGLVISRVDILDSFLLGSPMSSSLPQTHRQNSHLEHTSSEDPSIYSYIPNPVICLMKGDVILFQLHILHNRSASHYPVYQKQHLFNSNSHWDYGAFRQLNHLLRETDLNFSRFAHQFLDPGIYVFQDNGLPESMAVVVVKEKGVACDPSLSPMQPSSPYQLTRHGILRHKLPHLGPDWTTITGVLLAAGLTIILWICLGLMLTPSVAQAYPMRIQRPRWRGFEKPYFSTECAVLRDSPAFFEDPRPRGFVERGDSREEALAWGTGESFQVKTLEDFSIRTLYNKLEDQSLHMATQLSNHRSDALAFYKGARQQLQELKNFLQNLSPTDRQDFNGSGNPEMAAKDSDRASTWQSKRSWGRHTAVSPSDHWQHAKGTTTHVFHPGFQQELDTVIANLASALSHVYKQSAGNGKASAKNDEQPLSPCQPEVENDGILKSQPIPLVKKSLNSSPQQDLGLGQSPQGDFKGKIENPGSEEWLYGTSHGHRVFPALQRKIWQVENTLDKLNEEFFQLTAEALQLQTTKPDQLSPSEMLLREKLQVENASSPDRKTSGIWALKSDQILLLEVRRIHLDQQIGDLEWELSLLLQVSESYMSRRKLSQSGTT